MANSEDTNELARLLKKLPSPVGVPELWWPVINWYWSFIYWKAFPSLIIFVNAIFLFPKIRNLSLLLFSISIFYALLDRAIPSINYIENKVDDNNVEIKC